MAGKRWLSDREMYAWIGYRRMRLLLDLRLQRELANQSGLSEADYDVLSSLSEAAGQRMRLTDLARHMRWSPSRLSHQITRMQQRGLVDREECADDGRGSMLVLTGEGMAAIETAAPGHVASVRKHFIDLLSPEELDVLGALTHRVVDRLQATEDRTGASPVPVRSDPGGRAGRRRT
jgi:DNA-binding MarR family transcriptional regulator